MNFFSGKNQRIIASVIAGVLVIALVVSLIATF